MTDFLSSSAWLGIGLVVGLAVGWIMASRRVRKEADDAIEAIRTKQQQYRAEVSLELSHAERQITALRADDSELRLQMEKAAARVERLAAEGRELTREMDRAEARIFDRESTIDSLRAKLFASRNTTRSLERELDVARNDLDLLKTHLDKVQAAEDETVPEADPLSSIVVDLGETLSIERD